MRTARFNGHLYRGGGCPGCVCVFVCVVDTHPDLEADTPVDPEANIPPPPWTEWLTDRFKNIKLPHGNQASSNIGWLIVMGKLS